MGEKRRQQRQRQKNRGTVPPPSVWSRLRSAAYLAGGGSALFDGALQVSGIQLPVWASVILFAVAALLLSAAAWSSLKQFGVRLSYRAASVTGIVFVVSVLLYKPLSVVYAKENGDRTVLPSEIGAFRLVPADEAVALVAELSADGRTFTTQGAAWPGKNHKVPFDAVVTIEHFDGKQDSKIFRIIKIESLGVTRARITLDGTMRPLDDGRYTEIRDK